MSKLIDRLKLVFLGVFAFCCIGVWAYQMLVVAPARRCEEAGNWWDPEGHECATPVDVRSFPRLTPPPRPAATSAATPPPQATPAH